MARRACSGVAARSACTLASARCSPTSASNASIGSRGPVRTAGISSAWNEPARCAFSSSISRAARRLGAVVAPKEIDFQQSLPKTRSGKIMRRLLKARELGLPEGDVSTLESM